jgi:hypothetical protein
MKVAMIFNGNVRIAKGMERHPAVVSVSPYRGGVMIIVLAGSQPVAKGLARNFGLRSVGTEWLVTK